MTTLLAVGIAVLPFGALSQAEAAVANTIAFQGRLLSSPTSPAANQNFDVRFSFWADADFNDGVDRDGAGALVGAAWQEVVSMTTDSQGFFILDVGSVTALPEFDAASHRFLQAEVKASGAADTTYFVLDNKAADANVDRKSLVNSAYAQNALRLDGKSLGFGADNIPYLDGNGKLDRSLITDDQWLDPVADVTAMNAIASPTTGDAVYVASEERIYTYNGTLWVKTGADTDADLAALDSRVTTAESNITTNASAASTNATDIASNLAAIQSNDTDIANNAAGVASNLTSIQSNDTDIAANLAAIQSNDTDIAANLAAIQSNDTDITSLDARVTTNEGDITNRYTKAEVDNLMTEAINNLAWRDSVADVADLTTTYPTPLDGWTAYVSNVDEIYTYNGTAWVKTGAAFFEDATESVAGKVTLAADGETTGGKVVQANDSRLAQVGVNTSNIATNATDIASNLSAIQSNDTDITALDGRMTTAETNIAGNDTDIAANLAAIQSNDTDIAANLAAIQGNDTDISTNASDILANAGAITSNDGDIAANLSAIQGNDTDIAGNATDIAANDKSRPE